jgi:hypothetical protein
MYIELFLFESGSGISQQIFSIVEYGNHSPLLSKLSCDFKSDASPATRDEYMFT